MFITLTGRDEVTKSEYPICFNVKRIQSYQGVTEDLTGVMMFDGTYHEVIEPPHTISKLIAMKYREIYG